MPTVPYSWRFASATNAFPAPTTMSDGTPSSSPNAIAASACTPPIAKTRSAPEARAA